MDQKLPISDPSGVLQFFAELRLKIHCCRYWKLSEWSLDHMVSPFWRLYHNAIEGASIIFKDSVVEMHPDFVYLIPPNTSFSSHFKYNRSRKGEEVLKGQRITIGDTLESLRQHKEFDHFFVHFNLGLQYDNVKKGIYRFDLDAQSSGQINILKDLLRKEYKNIGMIQTAQIQTLILMQIQKIPKTALRIGNYDNRVSKVLGIVEREFKNNLSNQDLAETVAMAPNSFLRLFKENTGQAVHSYIQKKRIEESIFLMHHTNQSIEQIAQECGFCDRHHFSKAFKKQMKVSPAYYRKQLTMK